MGNPQENQNSIALLDDVNAFVIPVEKRRAMQQIFRRLSAIQTTPYMRAALNHARFILIICQEHKTC